MRERVGPQAFLRRVRASLPELSELLPAMPQLAYRALGDAVEGRLRVRWESPDLEGLRRDMRRHNRRTVGAVTGGSLLLSGSLIVTLGRRCSPVRRSAPACLRPARCCSSARSGRRVIDCEASSQLRWASLRSAHPTMSSIRRYG